MPAEGPREVLKHVGSITGRSYKECCVRL